MLTPTTSRSSLFGLALAAACAAAPAAARGADVPVDLELVLAVDISGSVDEVEAELQRHGYVAAWRDPRIATAIEAGAIGRIAVTYIEWANQHHQRTVVDWTVVEGAADAAALASALAAAPMVTARWTSISGAIDYAATLFEGNGYEGLRQVIDVSGDGTNNNGRPAASARDEAVARGITINGLPIMNDRPSPWGGPPPADLDLYYEEFVIGGPGAFIVVAEDFDRFASAILSKLIREIAGDDGPAPRETRHADAATTTTADSRPGVD